MSYKNLIKFSRYEEGGGVITHKYAVNLRYLHAGELYELAEALRVQYKETLKRARKDDKKHRVKQ